MFSAHLDRRTFISSCIGSAALSACKSQRTDVTLNVIGEAASAMDGLDAIKDDFTKQYGIKVVLHKFEFQTVQDKTLLDFTSRTGNYDCLMGIYYNLGKYVENDFIMDIEPFLADKSLRDPDVKLENFFKPILAGC
jgi:ABC-type glycerol-3-phosphate transport system substrate-binding protein